MLIALIVLGLFAMLALALAEARLWAFATVLAVLGYAATVFSGDPLNPLPVVPGAILLLFAVTPIRRALISRPMLRIVRRMLPRVSRTEQDALDVGTVGFDADLFSGRPNMAKLLATPRPTLNAAEQAFLDGPVETLCAMLDEWDIRQNRSDLPPEVWRFLKDNGFFGMLIAPEYGGLGFSAEAQSRVVAKVASRSIAAGITVMVPNSLGPGELLERYGTPEQKAKYLKRLARGDEIPCFALTGPHSGSDAAGMRDTGTVGYAMIDGEKVLGVRLHWDKRYITLAPVATLIGLAVHLRDPDHVLGETEDLGITLALVPATTPGVSIGRRHRPAGSAFMNGPTQGTNVFVPMDQLIGGVQYIGQGWRMLMECLATGRAISLPAIGTVSIKHALRVSSAYARIRRQFGIPIGQMEGVADPLSRLVRLAYQYEAARGLTATMVDAGERPSVLSALLKYRTTEAMRQAVNDAMDIHGGRGVQEGPSNYLFSAYAATPVAITVEGANILTRSLISFAQGALRAHPFLYAEIAAAQNPDQRAGLAAFDAAFSGHARFMGRSMVASLLHGLSGGLFITSPVRHGLAKWYRALGRYAQNFALVADLTVVTLGGDLKRKQQIAGRLADVLSDLYLLAATLKRFEDDGRLDEDQLVVECVARDTCASIERHLGAVLDNFPNRLLAFALGVLAFPLGRHARPAADRATYRLARAVMVPGSFRDRLTRGVYVTDDPRDPTGALEDAFLKVVAASDIETRFIKALKAGQITRRLDRDAMTDAIEAGILTDGEAATLRLADRATDKVIRVDDFAPDAFAMTAIGKLKREAAQ